MKRQRKSLEDRFWARVDKRGPDECWAWQGPPSSSGYGQLMITPPALNFTTKRPIATSRLCWWLHYGNPGSSHVDHECHNRDPFCPGGECPHRLCVNPAHLRLATPAENKAAGKGANAVNARKTHCKRGHEFTAANTITKTGGHRECRSCHNADTRRYAKARAERMRSEDE